MNVYALAQLDEIEELADGPAAYRPVRHHFGISSFGATAWSGRAAGDRIINDLDPGDPTSPEELFVVLQGRAEFEIGGDRVDAPVGTFVSVPPGTARSAVALEAETVVLALEGVPGQAYEPRGWELWAPLVPLYEAGRHAEVADRLRQLVDASPQYALLYYNLACCESVVGQTAEAIGHLSHAIHMVEWFRGEAKQDPDFAAIRAEPAFQELVAAQPSH